MSDLATQVQIAKLARLLDTDTESLAHLEHHGAEAIAALRRRMSDALFDSMAPTFDRVSKLAPLIPNQLVIALALKALPPQVAGRGGGAVGMAHRNRIVGVITGMTPEYLAKAAPHIDPRVIPIVAAEITADLLVPTANELFRQGDFLTASEFVEHAPPELIQQLTERITDDAGLIRTVAAVGSGERLNEVLRVIPIDRLVQIAVHAVDGADDVVLAALSVLSRTDGTLAASVGGEVFDRQDLDAIGRIITVAYQAAHLSVLLDALAHLDDVTLARVALVDIVTDVDFRYAAEQSADTDDRRRTWARVLELATTADRTAS